MTLMRERTSCPRSIETSWPSMLMRPASKFIIRSIAMMSDVLPLPDDPQTAILSPGAILKVTFTRDGGPLHLRNC